MKITLPISLVCIVLQSCSWIDFNESAETNPTIQGWYFRWLNLGDYKPTEYSALYEDYDRSLKQAMLFCSSTTWVRSDSVLHASYADHHFTSTESQDVLCGIGFRAAAMTNSFVNALNEKMTEQRVQAWYFLGDSALVIKPFARPLNDSSLVIKDSAYFKVIQQGVIKKNVPPAENIPWYKLADSVDTLLMFPELTSNIPREY